MGRFGVLTALGLVTLVVGCGDGDDDGDKTTTILPGPPPPAQTEPSTTEPTATTATPLPGGRAAVDGTYLMRIRNSDYVGQNIVAGLRFTTRWPIKTVCEQQTCRLEVRRELDSGAYESLTLDEIKDRSYAASSTGKIDCVRGETNVSARKRLSIRVSGIAEIDGRPTAQRVDAYMTISTRCEDKLARGVVSWRGTRVP